MPSDAEARRQAAAAELDAAVSGITRILDLIVQAPLSRRERQLLQAMRSELASITRAARVLGRA